MNAYPVIERLTKESIRKGEPLTNDKVVYGKYYYMRCETLGQMRNDYVVSRKGIRDGKEFVTIHYTRHRNGERVRSGVEARNEWEYHGGEMAITPECTFFSLAPHTGSGRRRRAKSHRKRNNRRKSIRRNSRR